MSKSVSKNVLLIMVLLVFLISIIGTAVIINNTIVSYPSPGVKPTTGEIKLTIKEPPKTSSTTGMLTLNIINKNRREG